MNDISAMEPMLVPEGDPALDDLTFDLNRTTARLVGSMPPEIRKRDGPVGALDEFLYYSNFLEGHQTTPREIERALRKDFSNDSKQRILQYEALAHIHVQQLIDTACDPQDLWPASEEYTKWLHREICCRLPAELLVMRTVDTGRKVRVVPGEYREGPLDVGQHDPPHHAAKSLISCVDSLRPTVAIDSRNRGSLCRWPLRIIALPGFIHSRTVMGESRG